MAAVYKVKVWSIQTRYKMDRSGKRVVARYVVRWMVEGERFDESFRVLPQADSFRSELVAASRRGEPFDLETGRPVASRGKAKRVPWFVFSCDYIDMKWDDSSPKYRSSLADSMTAITLGMLRDSGDAPPVKELSVAMRKAYNKNSREAARSSGDTGRWLDWLERNTRDVRDLAKPDVFRSVLASLERRKDGQRAAHDTIRLRRIALRNALDFAVDEKKLLSENPMVKVKVKKHKAVVREVDKRSVVNPVQGRTLLRAVLELTPRLYAFFALMYFAALRPEEAVSLRKQNLSIPEEGWGELHLEKATPEIGAEWTDSGRRGEERGLKHRIEDEGRTVPCSDELTEILHWHLKVYGTASDGRLFRGVRHDGPLSSSVYGRAWAKARAATFVPDVLASPLALRPYDLRHAAVSTWLNATGDPTRVAEWAGHSVGVLLRTYAKCLDGGEQQARELVAKRMKGL
ncbi:tyrosine-type recombinase/integrase [Amycolatopsis suaedae]|uniref:Integrase n=1 Tax=Amycolatopsis suaedae TaxID=2510978 RepID=A0A4V2EM87_9PSEU|nr:tyrosine-type recombinase/integrase [Amycolatopsis suaedae]RZQ64205.1 integrase [Amycolatopsis suaedae]